MKTSDPRHLLWAFLIGFVAAVPVILGIQGCADREPVKPVVVVPEVQDGPRQILIVHESLDRTPEVAAIFTALRAGEPAKYIADNGHTLAILDDDTGNPDGAPAEILAKHKAAIDLAGLPCVLIIDPAGKVLGSSKLPESADGVIELLKRHGG